MEGVRSWHGQVPGAANALTPEFRAVLRFLKAHPNPYVWDSCVPQVSGGVERVCHPDLQLLEAALSAENENWRRCLWCWSQRLAPSTSRPIIIGGALDDSDALMEWDFPYFARAAGQFSVLANNRAPARRADSEPGGGGPQQSRRLSLDAYIRECVLASPASLRGWADWEELDSERGRKLACGNAHISSTSPGSCSGRPPLPPSPRGASLAPPSTGRRTPSPGPPRSPMLPLLRARSAPPQRDSSPQAPRHPRAHRPPAPWYLNGWRAFQQCPALEGACPVPSFAPLVDQTTGIAEALDRKLFRTAQGESENAGQSDSWWLRTSEALNKLFLGPPGTVTRLHYDAGEAHGWLAQVVGRKLFVLLPPEEAPFLHQLPGERETAQSPVDPLEPDLHAHPAYRKAHPIACIVYPGETLLVPAGWWHYAVALDRSITLQRNFYHANSNARGLVGMVLDVVEKRNKHLEARERRIRAGPGASTNAL